MSKAYPQDVKNQYENLPYPERDPEDERTRLIQTVVDHAGLFNHYCFKGKQQFNSGFRCLVAGGGTGDSLIHLAEQLRNTNSEITYLDISSASMKVAQERASIRGLNNISWFNKSILELPDLDIEEFDYITCTGVLHHLTDRTAGLRALCSVLNSDGAMAIMVYGKHARVPVYQMQELMGIITHDLDDMQEKVDLTKKVVESLPSSNMFKQLESVQNADPEKSVLNIRGDAEVYDLFLHSQDIPLSIPDIYDWLSSCGLNLITFPSPPGGKYLYRPDFYISNPTLLEHIEQLPIPTQHAIAELISGKMITHTFYVSRKNDTVADIEDLDNIPFFFLGQLDMGAVAQQLAQNPQVPLEIEHPLTSFNLQPGRFLSSILRCIDGRHSTRQIFERVRNDAAFAQLPPDNQALMAEFLPVYKMFNSVDWMLLRSA